MGTVRAPTTTRHAGQIGVRGLLRCLLIGHHGAVTRNWPELAEAIRVERARRKWSQAELGERVSVSQGTIKNLEGGRAYKRIPYDLLRDLDRTFDWPVGTLEQKLSPAASKTASNLRPGRPEGDWVRREGLTPDTIVALDHIVMDIVAYVAPGTTMAEVQKIQERTRETAERLGFDTRRRRLNTHTDDDPEG